MSTKEKLKKIWSNNNKENADRKNTRDRRKRSKEYFKQRK